jgi:hypothetical protein
VCKHTIAYKFHKRKCIHSYVRSQVSEIVDMGVAYHQSLNPTVTMCHSEEAGQGLQDTRHACCPVLFPSFACSCLPPSRALSFLCLSLTRTMSVCLSVCLCTCSLAALGLSFMYIIFGGIFAWVSARHLLTVTGGWRATAFMYWGVHTHAHTRARATTPLSVSHLPLDLSLSPFRARARSPRD